MRRRRIVLFLTLAVLGALPALPADSAGMQTHAWMAVSAVERVQDPQLAALLKANDGSLRLGARFPDIGYFPGNTYGEEAHWQRFQDAYLNVIKNKTGCGDLTRPTGPCADDIAFLFGIVAHGTGDEVWDWLFEPNSPDHNEYYDHPDLAAFNDGGGQELTMDLVALGVYKVGGPLPSPAVPSISDLQSAFSAAGMPGINPTEFSNAPTMVDVAQDVETGWVPAHLPGVLAKMPWMSSHMVDGPGGVKYASKAIAGQWDHLWDRLLDRDTPSKASVTYPANDDRGLPASGWVRASYQPGSAPGRGGATTRIALSLTDALPFGRPGGPATSTELPAGSITITDESSGLELPLMAGYPKAVPYGAGSGTHTAAVQPAVDLSPCTWYRVATTDLLLDADGDPYLPTTFRFRTGQDAAGTRCADDPAAPPTTAMPTTTTTAVTTTSTPGSTPSSSQPSTSRPGTATPAPAAQPIRGSATYTG